MWSLASRRGPLPRSGTPLAANDTLTGSPKTLTYTPDGNYNGSVGFYPTRRASDLPAGCGAPSAGCDAASSSTEVSVPITVSPVNDKPTASDGSATMDEDSGP